MCYRLLLEVWGNTCITTERVFSALPPTSACWPSAFYFGNWGANSGEMPPSRMCALVNLIIMKFKCSRQYHHVLTEEILDVHTVRSECFAFDQRYLSELCCVDGLQGTSQATFPVVRPLLSANCSMSSIMAVFSLSGEVPAQCLVVLLRVWNCSPTCTTRRRATAATRTIRSCCLCWRAAVNPTPGQSQY